MEKRNFIELKNHRAIVEIPENSVEVIMHIKVFVDGEIKEVAAVFDQEMIRKAFQKADDGYIDEEDRFMITEKGLQYLEELERERNLK